MKQQNAVVQQSVVWALGIMSLAYFQHSTTSFALPSLLPQINTNFHLSDNQAAFLTVGYSLLYAFALIPAGLLADRVNRPALLAGGVGLWSFFTIIASKAQTFGDLLLYRTGFAAAQSVQNPVCFSMIPELFPKNKSFAMAVYNCAIYFGRAFSFGLVILNNVLAEKGVGMDNPFGPKVGLQMVSLKDFDVNSMQILFNQGDMVAVAPVYHYDFELIYNYLNKGGEGNAWREIFIYIGAPGLLISLLMLLTVREQRDKKLFFEYFNLQKIRQNIQYRFQNLVAKIRKVDADAELKQNYSEWQYEYFVGSSQPSNKVKTLSSRSLQESGSMNQNLQVQKSPSFKRAENEGFKRQLKSLFSPVFCGCTGSAALNDIASWALIAWQATFYTRVFELEPATYAPLLAVVIPVGGILGGVGGGLICDKLTKIGLRGVMTCGANILAVPLLYLSIHASDYKYSFFYLLLGFACSEAWRAPSSVIIHEYSPKSLGSTAVSIHLFIRNLIGSMGPILVATVASKTGDLQQGMDIIPLCYLLSGLGFLYTETISKKSLSPNALQNV